MRKKIIGFILSTMLLGLCVYAQAQQPKKAYLIGYLSSRLGIEAREEAFLKGLRELGYVEGRNMVIEWRFTKGEDNLRTKFAAELVRLKVDCIVSTGTEFTLAAKRATTTIPIVMGQVGDAVERGLVASLARPGGNVTGLTTIAPELADKRLELLKAAFPKVSRVAVLWDPTRLGTEAHFKEAETATRELRVHLESVEIRPPYDFERAFQDARKKGAEALMINAAGMASHRVQIINLEVKARLPVMYSDPSFVVAGGLMSYATDIPEQFHRAAVFVDKILKGAKPADLPVEQPTKFEFIINLKAAKQIGLTIPPNVLARADRVIK
jgi:putative tryptophan/tyrosine transport system substrate-binding protein